MRFTRSMASVTLSFNRRMTPVFPRVFELTNRVGLGHVRYVTPGEDFSSGALS
jgi:hypothetical protein